MELAGIILTKALVFLFPFLTLYLNYFVRQSSSRLEREKVPVIASFFIIGIFLGCCLILFRYWIHLLTGI